MSSINKREIFVPGRLCLFGEHSDWAGKYRTMNASIVPGVALVTGIEQGVYATVERSDGFVLTSEAAEIKDVWQDFSCPMEQGTLKEISRSDSFFCYCAGVASYMLEWYKVGGVHIHITGMTLPMKSGLSSSAAICVLVARAFNQLYDLNLSTMGEMNIAYWGELRTSSRCGRLDQACAFGVRPVKMTFDGEDVEVESFNIKSPLYWVFSDLNASKDTVRILADLNKGYPFAGNEAEEAEHKALGETNQDIVRRAIGYMKSGDAQALGQLMTEAQAVFDADIAPLCPSQLKAPKLHEALNDPEILSLTYGGKGVGSQGDGSVQFLARSKDDQAKLVSYLRGKGLNAYPLTIEPKHTVRKAIIPVAGFGTRLYPETRVLKKAFFPVIDSDGLVKPVILILVEELVRSGIEDICIVVGDEAELEQYRDFFERQLPDEHLANLSKSSVEYEKHIVELGKKLHYVCQTEKRGFGDAVYRCAAFAGNDPVLLMLGDTLYKSFSSKPCALQFIEAFERYGKPMVSICEVPLNQVSFFGILSGEWANKDRTVLQVSDMTEKPSVAYAEEYLGVKAFNEPKTYFSVFGQYILTPEVFAQLRDNIDNGVTNSRGEIELTTALDQVRQKYGLMGIRLDGKMYDMGNPAALRETFALFGKE